MEFRKLLPLVGGGWEGVIYPKKRNSSLTLPYKGREHNHKTPFSRGVVVVGVIIIWNFLSSRA
jgi:hypothetical protein